MLTSRRIATLSRAGKPSLGLFLVLTPTEICLALPGAPAGCNPRQAFFASAPFEIVELGRLVAAVVAPRVMHVELRTAAGAIPAGPTRDGGVLLECPGSCTGDRLVGQGAASRPSFDVAL